MRLPSLALRTRLALGYSLFFAVVLGLLTTGVFLLVRGALYRDIREQLQTSSDLIQQDFDVSDDELADYFETPAFLLRTHPPRVEGLQSPALYVQVAAPDGAVVARSSSLQAEQLPLSVAARAAALGGTEGESTGYIGDAPVLILARPLRADTRTVGVLEVAQPLREADRTLSLLLASLALTDVLALLAAVRGGAWLAQRALAPVGQIARAADQIVRAEHLGQRVPTAPANDELGQLTATVNAMLARLETLFTSQRRFVADVSHELKTPLTALRGNLELLRRGAARDPAALDESLAAIEREVGRLARLTNDLLVLAQADGGAPLRRERVALDEVVLEVVRELHPLAPDVALAPVIEELVAVTGDRDRIKQALINLVANALQHTPADGRVRVELGLYDAWAELRVRDTGAGIPPAALPHIFDRFYRADLARSRHTGGAGLGLAIVHWVAEAHGGSVAAESAVGAGSVFTLRLPL